MEEQNLSQEELEQRVAALEKEKNEYLAGWQRARADFLNHKKEERERMQEFIQYAEEELLLSFLPIVDNLERAQKGLSDEKKTDQSVQGFLHIGKQIQELLRTHDVEEIQCEGEKFNPEFHEALGAVEQEGKEQGSIAEVLEKGYVWKKKLLRPAKVKIVK